VYKFKSNVGATAVWFYYSRMRSPLTTWGLLLLAAATCASAQEQMGLSGPAVHMAPAGLTTVTQGKSGEVRLHFRVEPGYHVNSNKPKAEYLIPTTLKLEAPTDIAVGRISYPLGKELNFPFSPDEKLSVYSGEFTIGVMVRPLHTVLPIKYMFHGRLKYQACDNAACYKPQQLPVQFEIKVAKAAAQHGKNPAQSPHAHQ
jgi:cytochrome c biogenesis DsbD-like protein